MSRLPRLTTGCCASLYPSGLRTTRLCHFLPWHPTKSLSRPRFCVRVVKRHSRRNSHSNWSIPCQICGVGHEMSLVFSQYRPYSGAHCHRGMGGGKDARAILGTWWQEDNSLELLSFFGQLCLRTCSAAATTTSLRRVHSTLSMPFHRPPRGPNTVQRLQRRAYCDGLRR